MDGTGPDGGGDAVCWLHRVCDACGALPDGPPAAVCERCGAAVLAPAGYPPAGGPSPGDGHVA